MGAFGGLTLTNRGRILQSKAQTGIQLKYTRIALGDGVLGTNSILVLNQLIHEVKSLNISKLKVLDQGRAVVGGVLTNQNLSSGFYFRELGVFAEDPDVGEILYCYGNSGDLAEYIPAGGADIIEKNLDIQLVVGNASNVTAVIDEALAIETVKGAQEKANQAETNAKSYTDSQLAGLSTVATSGSYYDLTNKPTLGTAASRNTGTTNGTIPIIGADNKLDSSILPALAITDTFVVNSQASMLALTVQVGDVCVRTDLNKSFILKASPATTLSNWQELLTPVDAVLSVNGKTGAVILGKADVGLGSVENYGTATQAEAEAGTSGVKYMTPQRTKQAINANIVNNLTSTDTQKALSANQGKILNDNLTTLDSEVNEHLADTLNLQNIVLQNGWNGSIRYGKSEHNLLHLLVSINSGATSNGTIVGFLPEGYRVASDRIATMTTMGSTANDNTAVSLILGIDGSIKINGTAKQYISGSIIVRGL